MPGVSDQAPTTPACIMGMGWCSSNVLGVPAQPHRLRQAAGGRLAGECLLVAQSRLAGGTARPYPLPVELQAPQVVPAVHTIPPFERSVAMRNHDIGSTTGLVFRSRPGSASTPDALCYAPFAGVASLPNRVRTAEPQLSGAAPLPQV